jgi:hypothetical protein
MVDPHQDERRQQTTDAVEEKLGQFFVGVKLKPKHQLHAITKRLEKAVFIRR